MRDGEGAVVKRVLIWFPEIVAIITLAAVVAVSYVDACILCPRSCNAQAVRIFGRWIELPWHC